MKCAQLFDSRPHVRGSYTRNLIYDVPCDSKIVVEFAGESGAVLSNGELSSVVLRAHDSQSMA